MARVADPLSSLLTVRDEADAVVTLPEERVVTISVDNKKLRIWCTTSPTDVRLTTLMHDVQYRAQNCCQQSSYNQPPHVSFFLGTH